MDLELDIRKEIMKWLPHDRNDQRLVAELDSLGLGELVIRFFNWLNRLIHPHPRQVFLSQEYRFRYLPPREQVYLEKLIEKIEAGAWLDQHLSSNISFGFDATVSNKQNKKLHRRRDIDLLLNDWGIHHLHLPDLAGHNCFVRRDRALDKNLLLFAIFREGAAYLLDVLPHGAWANDDLVKIALRNWPEANLFIKAHGMLPSNQKMSRDDRSMLRSAGINSPIEFEGKIFIASTGGITSAGTPVKATLKANELLSKIDHIKRSLISNPDYLCQMLRTHGGVYPQNPQFSIAFYRTNRGYEFAIKEHTTCNTITL